MKLMRTEPLVSGFYFLEGPRWRDDRLWFSDMAGCKVYRVSLSGEVDCVVNVPERPSGLGFLADGTPLVVSMRDRCLFKIGNGALTLHADLSALVDQELNDMVVDRHGRAYVGSFGFVGPDSSHAHGGRLIQVEPTGRAELIRTNLMFPNGCAINLESQEFILAETFGSRLIAFQIGDEGSLLEPRLFADLGNVCPDGICLDSEGAVWVAAANQSKFVRVRDGGHITHQVPVRGRQAVACELGGSDGRTLFCLTADKNYEAVPGWGPTAGIECVLVDTPRPG